MNIWEPFDPIVYFMHIILGGLGIVGAIAALSVIKGSKFHIWAGRIFVFAAFVAALTAIIFSAVRFSGPAIASSVMTFSALGAALLALKPKTKLVFSGEIITTVLMGLALLWILFGTIMSLQTGRWLQPLIYLIFPLFMFIGDIRFLRKPNEQRVSAKLPRHYSRMGFAFAVAVHAPIVSFGNDLGIPPLVAFFGPLLIWPAIILFFNKRKPQIIITKNKASEMVES